MPTKNYRVRLNRDVSRDGVTITTAYSDKIVDLNNVTEQDGKVSGKIELSIEVEHEYLDLECQIEVEDRYDTADFDDGSYETYIDNCEFNAYCEFDGKVIANVEFYEDGAYSVELEDRSLELTSYVKYDTTVTYSEHDQYDDYNDDELISREALTDKILRDEDLYEIIADVVKDLDLELVDVDE